MKKVVYGGLFVVVVLVLVLVGILSTGNKSQNKSEASTSMTTESSTSKTSSSSSAEAEASSSTEASQVASDTSASSQATTASSTSASSPAQTAVKSTFDSAAIAKGDYSSIAGTWTNDEGSQLIITADGAVTAKMAYNSGKEYKDQLSASTLRGDLIFTTAIHEGGQYSDPLVIVPVGASLPVSGQASSSDRLQYGSDAQSGEDHFFTRSN